VTLSGVVAENGHPIENALLEVWWSCGRGCGRANEGMTDAAGRYTVAGLPEGETVWAIARKDGYVQQCVATVTTQANASLDVRLTSIANLSTARPLSGPGSRTVSGAVFEATPTGRQTVEDASVEVYSEGLFYYGEAVAFTRSDPAGCYLLCGLPQGPISYLYGAKQGYSVSHVSVEPGTDAIVDIKITRE
jgi:Carboxypeptidase regulatory-like domain